MRAALDQPVVAQREMITEVDGSQMLNTPIIDVVTRSGPSARPALERDWRAGLSRLGVGTDETDALLAQGVLSAPS
jgi:crotonobetainyl-CoA:carnitine CoA-transferase CaiB-like acyl-CoA transferase